MLALFTLAAILESTVTFISWTSWLLELRADWSALAAHWSKIFGTSKWQDIKITRAAIFIPERCTFRGHFQLKIRSCSGHSREQPNRPNCCSRPQLHAGNNIRPLRQLSRAWLRNEILAPNFFVEAKFQSATKSLLWHLQQWNGYGCTPMTETYPLVPLNLKSEFSFGFRQWRLYTLYMTCHFLTQFDYIVLVPEM